MDYLGFFIFLSTVLYCDYHVYIRGNDSIFFADKTQLEKDLREIQKLEVKKKLEQLKNNGVSYRD